MAPVPDFVHLHLHGCTSLLEGAAPAKRYLPLAARDGQRAMALTDTNGLYGFLPFFGAAEQTPVRPIIGACVREVNRIGEWEGEGARAVLLVKCRKGYGNLCRIISKRHLLPEEFSIEGALLEWGAGLIVLTDDEPLLRSLAGELPPRNLYVELRGTPRRDPLELARELELPVVATGPVFFPKVRDREVHRVLTAIHRNLHVRTVPSSALAPESAAFATCEEMARRFAGVPEALANTVSIADRCRFQAPRSKAVFPGFRLPGGETAYSLLSRRSFAGAAKRYRPMSPKVVRRLREELSVILELGFS